MQIKEIMSRTVAPVTFNTSLTKAIQKMESAGVAMLPVTKKDTIIGIVTKRHIVLRVLLEGGDPMATMVGEIMLPEVACCFENASVAQAAEIFETKRVNRLVILNDDGEAVGIVAESDLPALRS